MNTGQINRSVGYSMPNSTERPKIYLEKHFPIVGRTDFYKWVIVDGTDLAKDSDGNIMYFESFDLGHATRVVASLRRAAKLNNRKI